MVEEAPPPWSEIESFPAWKDLPTVKKTAIFQEWNDDSRAHAQAQGLWEPDFQKQFEDKSKQVLDSINKSKGWTEWYQEGAVNSLNVVRNASKAFHRGWLEGDVATELQKPNPDLKKITDLQKTITEYGPSAEFNTAWDDRVAPKDSWEAFKKDPLGNVAQLLAGSFGMQIKSSIPYLYKIPQKTWQFGAAGVAAGVAAGMIAGPGAPIASTAAGTAAGVAGLAGGFKQGLSEAQMAGSYAAEYGGDMIQSFQEAGIDVTNYDQMKAAFEDPAKIKEIKAHAQRKSVPVAVGDGILGAVAGSMFPGSTLVKGPVKNVMSKIGQWAGEMLFQGAGSATAEAASQVATEGKIYSPKSVIAEFGADVVADVVGVGVGRAANVLVDAKPEQQAKFSEVAPVINTLKENNAPLTAQALVKNTLKEVAVEDPNLVSDLIEEQAPEGTFTDQGKEDERFAPPRTEPAVETLAPVAEAETAPAVGTENAIPEVQGGVPETPQVEPTLNEITPATQTPQIVQRAAENQVIPAQGNIRPSQEAVLEDRDVQTLAEQPPPIPSYEQQLQPAQMPMPATSTRQRPVPQPSNVSANAVTGIPSTGGISPATAQSRTPAVITPEQNAVPSQQEVVIPEVRQVEQRIQNVREAAVKSGQQDIVDRADAALADIAEKSETAKAPSEIKMGQRVVFEGNTATVVKINKEDGSIRLQQTNPGGKKEFFSVTPEQLQNEQPTATTVQPAAVSQSPEGNVGLRPGEVPGEVQGVREEVPAGPTYTNEQQLHRLSGVTVSAPPGATFIRATDAKGRVSEEPINNVVKGLNPFHEAGPWIKVEAGTRDKKGNFIPTEGPIEVQDRAQAAIQKKINGFAKNQQAKAKKALSEDTSDDPYQGTPLTDKGPLRPEQNLSLLVELSRIGALDDNATGQTVLNFLSKDKQSPVWVRTLAKQLADIGANNVDIEAYNRPQSTWSALYVGKGETGKVMFNMAARNPGVAETVLHEIAHHVTLSKIEGKVDLTPNEQSALNSLQNIFDRVGQMKEFEGEYGLNNLGEFVSETFSNAGFRAKLDNITAAGDRVSAFQRVVNALARLLFNRASPGSLLEETMRNAIDLAGAPVVETPLSIGAFGQMSELRAMVLNAYRSGWYKQEDNLKKLVSQFPQSRFELENAYGRGARESRSLVAPMRPSNTVEIRAVNQGSKEIETIQTEATPELEKELRINESVYKQLIKCL